MMGDIDAIADDSNLRQHVIDVLPLAEVSSCCFGLPPSL